MKVKVKSEKYLDGIFKKCFSHNPAVLFSPFYPAIQWPFYILLPFIALVRSNVQQYNVKSCQIDQKIMYSCQVIQRSAPSCSVKGSKTLCNVIFKRILSWQCTCLNVSQNIGFQLKNAKCTKSTSQSAPTILVYQVGLIFFQVQNIGRFMTL